MQLAATSILAVLEIQFVRLTPKQIWIESRHQHQHNSSLTMPTSDAPALNPDGTLKDASEIEWLDSPSDENRTVSLKKKDDHNGSDKDGDGGGCDERSEPKDPLVEYEKMREYIQHECMVHAHTFLLSSHTHIE